MQIRPFEDIEYSSLDAVAFQEKGVREKKRDFYIYDKVFNPHASYLNNSLFTGVVQVNKVLVKGIPDEHGVSYNIHKDARNTFVKTVYFYNAFMNHRIDNPEEQFREAVFHLLYGYAHAYTDTKQCVSYMLNNYSDMDETENQFCISISSFDDKIRSLINIICNRTLLSNGCDAHTTLLGVSDPRYNTVKILDKRIQQEKSSNIPNYFNGNELIIKGQTSVHNYESFYKDNNSFAEDALINKSKELYKRNKYRLSREEAGIVPYNQDKLKAAMAIMDKKRILRSLLVDIIKAGIYSLFESFTMTYRSDKDPVFKMITPPFKQYVSDYMDSRISFLYIEFFKLSERVTDLFGKVHIMLHVTDIEHVVRCIFLDEPFDSLSRVITLRMTKFECLTDFITETKYGSNMQRERFMEMHDIDLLNYYAFDYKGDCYYYNGSM
jgi:hypothetical protein